MRQTIRHGIALVTLALAAGCLGYAAASRAGSLPMRHAKLIRVSAKRYEFVPEHLTLKLGETVDVELTTQDAVMGFNVPDLGRRATLVPGQTVHLRLTPKAVGEFVFLCDVFCGSGHEDMNGTITVIE